MEKHKHDKKHRTETSVSATDKKKSASADAVEWGELDKRLIGTHQFIREEDVEVLKRRFSGWFYQWWRHHPIWRLQRTRLHLMKQLNVCSLQHQLFYERYCNIRDATLGIYKEYIGIRTKLCTLVEKRRVTRKGVGFLYLLDPPEEDKLRSLQTISDNLKSHLVTSTFYSNVLSHMNAKEAEILRAIRNMKTSEDLCKVNDYSTYGRGYDFTESSDIFKTEMKAFVKRMQESDPIKRLNKEAELNQKLGNKNMAPPKQSLSTLFELLKDENALDLSVFGIDRDIDIINRKQEEPPIVKPLSTQQKQLTEGWHAAWSQNGRSAGSDADDFEPDFGFEENAALIKPARELVKS